MMTGFALAEVVLDPDGRPVDYRFLELNPAFEKLTGLKASEVVGRTVMDAIPGIEREWIERFGKVALTGLSDTFERYAAPLDRHYNVLAYRHAKGQFAVLFTDITERVKADNKQRELVEELKAASEEQARHATELDAIISSLVDPVIILNTGRKTLHANRAAVSELGFDPAGLHADDIVARLESRAAGSQQSGPADRLMMRTLFRGAATGGEFTYVNGRGEQRTAAAASAQLLDGGRVIGTVVTLHDITAARDAEAIMQRQVSELGVVTAEALRRADEVDTLLASITEPVILFDTDRDPVRVNAAARTYLGFDPLGMTGRQFAERLDLRCGGRRLGPDEPAFLRSLKGETVRDAECDFIDISGRTRTALLSSSPLAAGMRITGAVLSLHDITDRKIAEDALARASDEWERTFDTVPDMIAIMDDRHRILRSNRAMADRMGSSGDRCIGLNCFACVHGTDAPIENCPHTLTLRDGKEHVAEVHDERLGGDFLVSTTPLRDERGNMVGSVHVARDITDLRKSEEAVQRALEETKRREADVSALLQSSRHILETQDFSVSARRIFDACVELIGARSGYVALLSEGASLNEVLFLESGGLPCTVDPSLPMPIRGLRAEAYRTGKPVFDNAFPESEHMKFMPRGHVALANVLFAPLVLDGKAVGLLGMANKAGGFTDDDARIAAAFGELAAIALRNSRNLEAMRGSQLREQILTENSDAVVLLAAASGAIRSAGGRCAEIVGWPPEELIGKTVDFVHPEDVPRFRSDFARAASGAAGAPAKYRVITRSGGTRSVSLAWFPVRSGGQSGSVMGIMRRAP